MSKFVIEKAVPLKRRENQATDYPLAEMVPGDSFFVPVYDLARANRIRMAARYNQMKIAVRKEAAGMRVWRIA